MMALFLRSEGRRALGRDVVLFGTGTIGRPILRQLRRRRRFSMVVADVPWTDPGGRTIALRELEHTLKIPQRHRPLSVVWAAGRAGFSATEVQTAQELAAYRDVVEFVRGVQDRSPSLAHQFHLVSSAGGLYEGQVVRSLWIPPSPSRSYGHLKLEQERIARDTLGPERVIVYRPSSVYSAPGANRPGLVGVLVGNGIARRVTTIVGALSTLRDYVMADDVGAHIADHAMGEGEAVTDTHMLVSGRPASIQEVITSVESTLRRPVYVRMAAAWNARNIAFSPSVAAPGFHSRPVAEGIRSVYAASLGRAIT